MGGDSHGRHILVIDDEPAVLDLYRDLFEEEGFRVSLWPRPPADLAPVLTLAPDLVLLDLLIGHEELGWRFLQRLKTDPATTALPVVVCTAAVTLLGQVADQLRAWDCAVVAKPFDIDPLLAAVRAGLRPDTNGAAERAG